MKSQYEYDRDRNVGLFYLIPLFLIILFFVGIPLLLTFFRSFTNFNFIQSPIFVGLENYVIFFLKDDVAKISIRNQFYATILSSLITVGLSFLCAWYSSRLHKNLKIILCITFLIGSITTIYPLGLMRLFSSDQYNFINSYLLQRGLDPLQFLSEPSFVRSLLIIIPTLVGMGPLFLLFTIGFLNKEPIKKYFHLAVTTQIVISFIINRSLEYLAGMPSVQYASRLLSEHVSDYLYLRYEGGYGSALIIIMGIILLLLLLIINGFIWFLFKKIPVVQEEPENIEFIRYNHSITDLFKFLVIFALSIVLLFPFTLVILDSFKSLDDLFAFPPKIFPKHPTINNYIDAFTLLNPKTPIYIYFINTLKSIIIVSGVMAIITLLSNIGYSKVNEKIKKQIKFGLLITVILSPLSMMWLDYFNKDFITVVMSLFKSFLFGLGLLLSTKMYDYYLSSHKTSQDYNRYFLGIVSICLLSSLSLLINPLFSPINHAKWSLFHIIQIKMAYYSRIGTYSSIMVLSMILPILIIIVSTPLLINSLIRKEKRISE